MSCGIWCCERRDTRGKRGYDEALGLPPYAKVSSAGGEGQGYLLSRSVGSAGALSFLALLEVVLTVQGVFGFEEVVGGL